MPLGCLRSGCSRRRAHRSPRPRVVDTTGTPQHHAVGIFTRTPVPRDRHNEGCCAFQIAPRIRHIAHGVNAIIQSCQVADSLRRTLAHNGETGTLRALLYQRKYLLCEPGYTPAFGGQNIVPMCVISVGAAPYATRPFRRDRSILGITELVGSSGSSPEESEARSDPLTYTT